MVKGNRQRLSRDGLLERLRAHKATLVEMLADGRIGGAGGMPEVPDNGILPGCTRITPDMLTLVSLDQASIDHLVERIPGGAANVQDIYPLAPLQQGILYHHASASHEDPYVMQVRFAFASEQRLAAFVEALQVVIDRHDILRTSVHWDGLETPLQVVWRQARLQVDRHPVAGAARLELSQAPLLRLVREEAQAGRPVQATLLFHHIAMDHSALDVVRQEIQACLCGQAGQLGEPVAFRKHVAQALLGLSTQAHEAFFADMLGDVNEPTLAHDRQDLSGEELVSESCQTLEPSLSRRLRGQARTLGISVASVFHLAWARVLAGLTGREQVVFGTVLMGRLLGAEATERALGIFINTLPLRLDIDERDVRSAVKATHVRLATMMRHEHAPLALAQRCSGVAPPTPLFNSLLNYRHSAPVTPGAETWQGIEVLHAHERSNYPLVLSIDDLGEGFALTAQSAPGIDGQRICGYMTQTLGQLLDALEQAPQTPIEDLQILPAEERRQLLHSLAGDPPRPICQLALHQRIEQQAERQPQALALQAGEQQLSYAQLNQRANALAHHLIDLGIRPDDRIAVVARRSPDTLVALLAVLKAGAGYVPVDPAHPDERIAYLLADAAPRVVLAQKPLRQRLGEPGMPVIALDHPDWPWRTHDPQVAGLSCANLAYVIYTSGSTGQPKGVMVEHGTLNNLVDWHCQAFDLRAGSHTASVAGFGFDAMAWEIWPALCAGASLHLPPPGIGNEQVDMLLDWWLAQPLQVGFLPTPVAEHAFSRGVRHPTLRTLLIGGDRLRQFDQDPGFAVVNNYGPTETTVVATSGLLTPGTALDIGRPIANTRVYLLDARQRLVPLGMPGEIHIAGAGVARGYLNRAQLTEERFLRDPFVADPQARMYRSGDMARWNPDGTLEYLGRNDDQVKVRGMRIELGEVESQLGQLPEIEQALVVARQDPPQDSRLVAYFTLREGCAASVDALRAALLARLPGYMVPSALVRLERWPLTANGKVDRRALPVPDREAVSGSRYQAPEGELEQALAGLWSELLQVEQVGRHDRFFDLGGHSLLAMRMVSQVRQRLGRELALSQLFADSELAAVARCLADAGQDAAPLPPIEALPRGTVVPLSFAQQRLWFLAQMDEANAAYNIPLGLHLRGQLDTQALERALLRIVERHDSLRSQFHEQDGQAQVRPAPVTCLPRLHRHDLRGAPQAALRAAIEAEAAAGFDLGHELPVRGRLLCLAEDHHVLLLTLHHIVADGWSLGVLTRELAVLYEAYGQGRQDPLPALALQYADYAQWQRGWLEGKLLARQGDYWEQALSGAPAVLTLPTDRPRPARPDYVGASVALKLDAQLSEQIRQCCRRQAVTPFMLFMGAWAVLLGRLAGQTEVVIGMPVANRRRAEVENMIGLFVNTLAVRIDTAGEPDLTSLLAQVRRRVIEAQQHQDMPFEQVVERLRPPRSLAHSPLFQVSLAWDGSQGTELRLPGLQVEPLREQPTFAKFDLTLSMAERADGFVGALDYATALFDQATIERHLGYLERMLAGMVASERAVPAMLDLLGAQERQRLLVDFNASELACELDRPLQALFEAQARRTPDAIALQDDHQTLSYRQLNEAANRLAHHLIELGVDSQSRVGVCLERGPALVIGLLAALKAGAAYVPLDPGYPAERLAYMLADSAARIVLVDGGTRARLADGTHRLVNLQDEQWAQQPAFNPRVPAIGGHHLAYVIYTSGSTGTPKGVMVEHRGVCNLLHWSSRLCPLPEGAGVLHKTPVSFDASVWELFWPLCSGLRLVLARPDGQRDPLYLAESIQRHQVSVVQFVPALLQQFLDAEPQARCASLTDIVCGGGELTVALARQVRQCLPWVRLHNVYGPTEATVDCSAWTLEPQQPVPAVELALPIGRPIGNTRLYVLDGHGRPVPQGVAGELHIGGVGVARGYLNLPELQAARFIASPFVAGDRLYRSGDLVRQRGDGALEFLGRNDFQVKLHGLRIELGEIEAQLRLHPALHQAAVLLRGERLVAWYTCRAGQQAPGIEALRQHLLATLPDYMVPSAYVHLPVLPLTPNGKLDRAALPEADEQAVLRRVYQPPQGEVETRLAQVWRELLGVTRVGRQDNFFELGGHSLLAVTLVARMRRLGLGLDIRVLFAQPTLQALASAVDAPGERTVPANLITGDCRRITPELLPLASLDQAEIDRVVAQIPGGVANVQDIYPLGPLQTGILYHHLSAGENDPYVLAPRFAIADQTRLEAFRQALQAAIRRHDILRTSLHWEGLSAPVQAVWRQASLPVRQVDLETLARPARMDLNQAPLLRLEHAADPRSGTIVAVLRLHHAIMDHVSLDTLTAELQAWLLDAGQQLPEPVPYRNYVAQVVSGLDEAAHERFFREQLADIDEPTLPYGIAQGDAEADVVEARARLEQRLGRSVREQARRFGVSAASLMHLAWGLVLGQLSGRDSVVFGSVLLGRLQGGEGAERALGVFINTLPVRLELQRQSVGQALAETHRRLSELLAHEHAQLALAQRCSGLPAGAPLFATLLNYRHGKRGGDETSRMAWQGIEVLQAEERSNYPLTVSVDDLGDGFALSVQALAGIDPQRIAAYLQEAVAAIVQALVEAPDRALDQLSVLPPSERQRLLHGFNDSLRDYPREHPTHRLFEQSAARRPMAIAARHDQQQLSYGELNERANRLAHHLLECGVRPHDLVAILLPRSLDLLVAQLAVGKCAAAYVPLDINAPAERQRFMIADCQAVALLTHCGFGLEQPARRIELDRCAWQAQPAHDPGLEQDSGSVAYVMYTSGSTGTPKGVRVTHRGIARLVLNDGYTDLSEQDVVAFASNPAFDASTLEVWGALLNGACLQVIDHPTLVEPQRLKTALQVGQVSVLFLTTALFNQYSQTIPEAFAGLRMLLTGGEPADPAAFARLRAQAPGLRLVNGYGPTETTTFATTFEAGEVAHDALSLPIGRPIGNTCVYVLDARQRLVPLGAVGELYIGGDGVALGYLGQPQLSQARFLPDPFSTHAGATMYRTGDLGRWREDGQLECLGRTDDQVKIRGFRIELGEIVSRLHQLPGIAEAVVVVREDEPGQVRLVAYYTSQSRGQALPAAQMRARLQAELPEYMLPAAFVELTTLPLTANGKLDRKALPQPDRLALFGVAYAAPEGELESALARIWSELLQVERVGRHDHFFDLGGHSLLAMRMVSQVRQQLGLDLPLGELFALGELAAVAQALATGGRSELASIPVAARDRALPLSFAQQRLWFLEQLEGASQAYTIAMALGLRGNLQVAALDAALQRIVERHETLRSRFVSSAEGAEVLTWPCRGGGLLQIEDMRAHPEKLAPRLRQEAGSVFDLASGPLLRARLLQLADDYHVLSLAVHHIVADGWSMGVLGRELMTLYPALCQGREPDLPALPIQYGDYAAWQRDWLAGERLQRQASYWREALDGAPSLLALPTDRPRPARQDFAGASLAIRIEQGLAVGLRGLSQRHGATLYMTLMTAWAALLARLSGQPEVVIGSPVAGRGRAELEGLVGLFVNTLAVRVDTCGQLTGQALLARVRAQVLAAQEHQDLPFEQVVEIVRPARSLAHAPLFQNTLNWLPGDTRLPELDGLHVETVEQASAVAKFDLSLNLGEQGEALVGSLDYATALFDEGTVRRYAGYFERLLRALVADDQVVLSEVPLVDDEERRCLLERFNQTAQAFAVGSTVHALVEAQARQNPQVVAIQADGQCLDYAELNRQANALAHWLVTHGVRVDDRVAVFAQRTPSTLVALLAVLKAGACYVPIDPAHPDERVAYLLEDSGPVVVLAQAALHARLPRLAVPLLALDRPDWPRCDADPRLPELGDRHLAYVIYTSGSTGQPKGVMVEHRTLANLVHWHRQAFDLHPGSQTASVAGLGFDAMAWEVWPALCAGATVHLPPVEVANEQLDDLLDWWQTQPLQVAFLPTSVAEYALGRGLRHPTLRTLLIGGDRLRQFDRDPGFALVNNYGPTEATVVATSGRLLPGGRLDIGKPIANTRIYLLDDRQQLVPVGVAGELYIGGRGVARGYLGRPELSAERFLRDPFVDHPQARMYRTGDLARWHADGTLEYLGRNDDQVKIRGLRIELGEIESQLGQLPGIQQALVVARDEGAGQARLVGYFIDADAARPVPLGELRAALLARLPAYMVPSALVRLQAWPLTANGKVDRRALPAPDRQALSGADYQAPQGQTETLLAELWSELLHVERVGRNDHFFELGGHSLLAVTLLARMRRAGLDADIRVLFAEPTLAALAAAVGQRRASTVPSNLIDSDCQRITPELLPLVQLDQASIDRVVASVPGATANVQDIYPLGPLQAGIFYHHLAAGEDDPYLLQARFAFADRQRLETFCQALDQVIERHDVLRTALCWEGLEAPVQVVWRQASLPVEKVSLPALDRPAPLALDRAPLLRLAYADDPGNAEIVGVMQFHHLIMDHMALELLAHELQAILQGRGHILAAPVPYRDHVAQTMQGPDDSAHEAFFREQLGDIDEATLPYGQLRFPAQTVPGEARQRLASSLCRRVREQARQAGVSAASLMHLAWGLVLGRLAGREQVVFGTVMLGRMQGHEGVERALGVFINTLPLRVDLGERSVEQALAQTHQRLTALLAHEHAALALVQRCSGLPAGAPLFSALFNYRHSAGQPASTAHEASVAWEGIELRHAAERSSYPLTVSVDDLGDAFEVTALTRAGVDARRICAYLDCAIERLLEALEQDRQIPLQALTCLPANERTELLERFNDTSRHHDRSLTIHARIEHQAARRPDAIAAQCGAECLTYAQLNAQANALAHQLIDLGVGPERRVAVVARRSLRTLAALLGILKAGGGYVPIDPEHPDERIAYLLADSEPAVVLAEQASFERLPSLAVPLLDLDQRHDQWPAHDPRLEGSSTAHLAYVIYTSGSTGQPKGVMVEHRTLGNLVDWHCRAFELQAGSHTASVAGFGFDAMAWEVWPALCAGAVLHLPPAEVSHDRLDLLLDWWVAQPLDVAFLPTPVAELALSRELRHPTLRTLLTGGDRLRQFEQDPGFAVVNNYGPTEATVVATSGSMRVGGVLHIGKPIDNVRLYVLDERAQPVPLGVPGELYIAGAGVARGYLKRPQLTAERFLADPFDTDPQARMYRTGDLVRWLADGNLEYLGRNDDQVKIRGMRVELGEIEQCLARCQGVGEAVVVAQPLTAGALRLVAYFTAREPAAQADSLRAELSACLPEHMVPTAFVALDALPLTRNGKVDRRALPLLDEQTLGGSRYQAPATPLERRLAKAWAQVLEVRRVGRHDSFFELGGHSLSAIRLVSLLHKQDLPLTLAELFQHPSVAAAAVLLEQRSHRPGSPTSVVTVRAGGSQPGLFLVHDFTGLDGYFPVLGQHLPGDFPIHGLPGIELGEAQLDTMEALAARLAGIIRQVQPQGPYRLAGWSFGGVLAYEVAMQLLGMDEQVAFLGLIDSYVPRLTDQGKARWQGPRLLERQLLAHCVAHWHGQGEAGQGPVARLAQLQQATTLDFEALLVACREQGLLYPELEQASDLQLRHYLQREVAHGHALAHYRLEPLCLPVHLLRASRRAEDGPGTHSPTLGWSETLPSLALHCVEVPGDHLSMMRSPHVQALGQAIVQAMGTGATAGCAMPAYQPLLAVQVGKPARAPLFCVPGAGDSVTSFIGLAEALGPDWPLHGVQPRGLDGRNVPHTCVHAAARCHVQAIEASHPDGPLHLVGHSFGGWVAHAMAVELQVRGRQVLSLTIIDSEAPGAQAQLHKAHTFTAVLQALIEALELSAGKSLGLDLAALAAHDDATQLVQLQQAMIASGLLPPRLAEQALAATVRTFASALRTGYPARAGYTGPARLVQVADPTLDAEHNARARAAASDGWRRVLPQLQAWQGPGDHFSILKAPDVYSLAAWWYEVQALAVGAGDVVG